MSKRAVFNVPASVHARLMNIAKASGRPFNEVLQHFALERFLFRLSKSAHAEHFVLKGALMLRVWGLPAARPTMDIDVLGKIPNDAETVRAAIQDCMRVECADGVALDERSIVVERIALDADYAGLRATFRGSLGKIRLHYHVDVGLGDAVKPAPVRIEYPQLLDFGAPRLTAYRVETAIAEKFQAMVELEAANSRMKDFHDIYMISRHLTVEGPALAEAIEATFGRRSTPIPIEAPLALTTAFAGSAIKQTQWRAFVRRLMRNGESPELEEITRAIGQFLMPVAVAAAGGSRFEQVWAPGGPWREQTR